MEDKWIDVLSPSGMERISIQDIEVYCEDASAFIIWVTATDGREFDMVVGKEDDGNPTIWETRDNFKSGDLGYAMQSNFDIPKFILSRESDVE